jgi:hypothetical protein
MADPITELKRVAQVANIKRQALAEVAQHRTRMAKALHLGAGICALVSAGSITAIIADVTSSLGVKVVSACLSFASGVITLVFTNYYDEKETRQIYDGAAKFHHIRERADLARGRPETTEKQAFADLIKIRAEYREYSSELDRFLSRRIKNKGPYAALHEAADLS